MKVRRQTRLGQTKIYIGKCLRIFINEKQWKLFITSAIIIIIIALVTGDDMFRNIQDTRKGAFALVCACIWIGLFNSIQSIVNERDIIKREHRTGLHISSYVLAHVVYEFLLCLVEAMIVLEITLLSNHSHLPPEGLVFGMVIDLFITVLLIIFASDMLALIISCLVRRANTAMTIMPFILIIQLVMSGMLFDLEGITDKISNLTISRWGLNAIVSIANTDSGVKEGYDLAELSGCTPSSDNLLKLWLIILVFAAVYVFISIILLERVDKDKR